MPDGDNNFGGSLVLQIDDVTATQEKTYLISYVKPIERLTGWLKRVNLMPNISVRQN